MWQATRSAAKPRERPQGEGDKVVPRGPSREEAHAGERTGTYYAEQGRPHQLDRADEGQLVLGPGLGLGDLGAPRVLLLDHVEVIRDLDLPGRRVLRQVRALLADLCEGREGSSVDLLS